MECWKAFTTIEWFSSSNNNKMYKHGEQSGDLNSGLQNSFELAYFGEVVTKHWFYTSRKSSIQFI